MRCELPSSLGLRGSGYAAMDHNGQAVAVIPSKRLVVVQTADRHDSLVELRSAHFIELLHLIVAATSSAMPQARSASTRQNLACARRAWHRGRNVPILIDGAAWGVLEVDSTEPRDFSTDTVNFLFAASTVVGIAIQRAHIGYPKRTLSPLRQPPLRLASCCSPRCSIG